MTDKTGPQEFWLTGEPNEHDVGIWYDHDPGVDVVYGKPFHRYHVVEYSAYAALKLELNRMQDLREAVMRVLMEKWHGAISIGAVEDMQAALAKMEAKE